MANVSNATPSPGARPFFSGPGPETSRFSGAGRKSRLRPGAKNRYHGVVLELPRVRLENPPSKAALLKLQAEAIPRPRRKDLMSTVFRARSRCPASLAAAGGPLLGDEYRTRMTRNSLVAAIDVPRTRGGGPAVRPPPKIPAQYQEKLTSLERERPVVDRFEAERERRAEQFRKRGLAFKFAPDVGWAPREPSKALLMGPALAGGAARATAPVPVAARPDEGSPNSGGLPSGCPPASRPSSAHERRPPHRQKAAGSPRAASPAQAELPWKEDPSVATGGEWVAPGVVDLKGGVLTRVRHRVAENFYTSNVPFMLEIWKATEGRAIIDEEDPAAHLRHLAGRRVAGAAGGGKIAPTRLRARSPVVRNVLQSTSATDLADEEKDFSVRPPPNSILATQKLSESTDNLLRKLAYKENLAAAGQAAAFDGSASSVQRAGATAALDVSLERRPGSQDGGMSDIVFPKSVEQRLLQILTGARAEDAQFNIWMPGLDSVAFNEKIRRAKSARAGLGAAGAVTLAASTKEKIGRLMRESFRAAKKFQHGEGDEEEEEEGEEEELADDRCGPRAASGGSQGREMGEEVETLGGTLPREVGGDPDSVAGANALARGGFSSASPSRAANSTAGLFPGNSPTPGQGGVPASAAEPCRTSVRRKSHFVAPSALSEIPDEPGGVASVAGAGKNGKTLDAEARKRANRWKEDFSLARLSALVKINSATQRRRTGKPKSRQSPLQYQRPSPLPVTRAEPSLPPFTGLSSFLASPYAQILEVPEPGSELFAVMLDGLTLALEYEPPEDAIRSARTARVIRQEAALLIGRMLNHGRAGWTSPCPDDIRQSLVNVYMDAVACQAADRDGEVPQESEAAGARLRWMAACGLVKLGYARAEGVLAQLLREGFDDCLERGELSTDEGKTEFAEQKRRRAAAVETLVGFAAAAAAERRLRNAEGPAFAELRRPRQLAAEDDARFVLRAVANGLSSSSWRVRHGCAECAGRILGLLPPDQPWPEEVSAAGCPEASAAAAATPPPARPEAARGGALAAAKEPARPPPAAEEDPAEASARETTDLCTSVLRKLLGVFWNDWNHDVRASAGAELTKLDAGRSIFLWAVELIKGDHPVRRVDALRTLACLKTLAKSALPAYLDCFRDSYVVVRVEACKVACVLGTPQKQVVDALLDSLEDCDTRVRAYALKALGRSKCTSRHVTDALLFHATHEHHPAVRAEACRAAAKLGCVAGNRDMVRALSDLVLGDVSERVRREAAAALQATGEAAVPRSEAEPKPLTTATGGILPAAAESEAAVVDAVRVLSTTAAFRRQALNDYVVGGGCLPLSLSEDTDAMAALLKVTKQPELSYKIRMAKTTRGNLLLRYKDA